jgi:hypothetical protein
MIISWNGLFHMRTPIIIKNIIWNLLNITGSK